MYNKDIMIELNEFDKQIVKEIIKHLEDVLVIEDKQATDDPYNNYGTFDLEIKGNICIFSMESGFMGHINFKFDMNENKLYEKDTEWGGEYYEIKDITFSEKLINKLKTL